MSKFIHTADWQIGMKFSWLKESARARMQADRLEAISSISDLCKSAENGIEFVLVCGDLFDSANLSLGEIAQTCRYIAKIPVPVYAISGNHEWGDFRNIFNSENFQKEKPENLTVLEPGLHRINSVTEIYALPTTSKHGVADPLEGYEPIGRSPGVKRILALHGIVDRIIDLEEVTSTSASAPISFERLKQLLDAGEVDYVALGDRHSTTDVELKAETFGFSESRIFYSGSPEATSFRDTAAGNVLLVDLQENQPRVECRKVGKWRFVRIGLPGQGKSIEIDSKIKMDQLLEEWLKMESPTTCVKIYCNKSGYSLSDDFYFQNRLREFDERYFASFKESERNKDYQPIIKLNIEEENPLALKGYMRDAYQEIQLQAASGNTVALDALQLLHKLRGTK